MAVTLIAHTEVGSGGAAAITFSSIPGTYDDLWIQYSLRTQNAVTSPLRGRIQLNSDTAANYSMTEIYGDGIAGTSRRTSDIEIRLNGAAVGDLATTSTFASNMVVIPAYANTSNYKQLIYDGAAEINSTTNFRLTLIAGLWQNTAAITSVSIFCATTGADFVQYSTATLYGVKKF